MLLMRVLAFIVVILWKRFLDIKHQDVGDLFYRDSGPGDPSYVGTLRPEVSPTWAFHRGATLRRSRSPDLDPFGLGRSLRYP